MYFVPSREGICGKKLDKRIEIFVVDVTRLSSQVVLKSDAVFE